MRDESIGVCFADPLFVELPLADPPLEAAGFGTSSLGFHCGLPSKPTGAFRGNKFGGKIG